MGSLAGQMFDKIIIRHDKDGRGRTNEALTQLITEGIKTENPSLPITIISDELEALNYAIQHAEKGTFVVNSSEEIQKCIELISSEKQKNSYSTTAKV